MQTAHQMFIHDLQDLLDAEQQLIEALGKQAEECSRPDLQKAFQSHQAQTEKQAERLRQCFEFLGEEPEEAECAGIRGLIQEHDNFVEQEDPAEDLVDIFNTVAAAKVESYEIQAYQAAIRFADIMGHSKVSRLLNQSLKEEQQTLKKMEGFGKKLKPENLGMEEEEEIETGSAGAEIGAGRKQSRSSSSRSRRGRAA